MAGTPIRMSKIKQVLRMHQQGFSNRCISRELGLDKGTVNEYVRKVQANQFNINTLLALEDPVLEQRFCAGSPAYTDTRFARLKDRLSYFEQELRRPHVTRYLLWQEYLREDPQGYRYSQFCYHLSQLQTARHPSAVLDHPPGLELYVDFAGDTLPYVNPVTGEISNTQIFVACLPCSDYTFAMAVPSQSTDDFLHALTCSLEYFGGTPKILVPDNLKAAVTKADRYEPDLNRILEDLGNHYGFVVLPARVKKPKDKAYVKFIVM